MSKNDERAWTVLNTEYIIKRPWLTARCDTVQLPNGNINSEYYILEYAHWINVLAITKEGKFVFVRQYRHGLQRTCYELCAGVCEPEDGSPLVSARRELLEETGYGGGRWEEYMVISANPGAMTNLTYCFLATDVEPVADQALEDTEDLTVHLLTLDEVKQLLADGQIMQALHAAPLWKYVAGLK